MYGLGDGVGTNAQFYYPAGLTADTNGNVYVADAQYHKVRKILPSGLVTSYTGAGYAGNGDGPSVFAQYSFSKLNVPSYLAADKKGNVYVADTLNAQVKKILTSGVSTFFTGNLRTSGVWANNGMDGYGTSVTIRALQSTRP